MREVDRMYEIWSSLVMFIWLILLYHRDHIRKWITNVKTNINDKYSHVPNFNAILIRTIDSSKKQ